MRGEGVRQGEREEEGEGGGERRLEGRRKEGREGRRMQEREMKWREVCRRHTNYQGFNQGV